MVLTMFICMLFACAFVGCLCYYIGRNSNAKVGTPSASHNSESAPCEVAASCPVHRCRECRRYYDDMYQLT